MAGAGCGAEIWLVVGCIGGFSLSGVADCNAEGRNDERVENMEVREGIGKGGRNLNREREGTKMRHKFPVNIHIAVSGPDSAPALGISRRPRPVSRRPFPRQVFLHSTTSHAAARMPEVAVGNLFLTLELKRLPASTSSRVKPCETIAGNGQRNPDGNTRAGDVHSEECQTYRTQHGRRPDDPSHAQENLFPVQRADGIDFTAK